MPMKNNFTNFYLHVNKVSVMRFLHKIYKPN